jgi:hypothetical protein
MLWFQVSKHKGGARMKIGIGYHNGHNATESGQAVMTQALEQGQITRADLVLAFCNGQIDAEDYFRGMQSVVGTETPIVGGSAIGIITNQVIAYTGAPAGAVVVQAEELRYALAAAEAVDRGEYRAGQALGTQLAPKTNDTFLLIFYDSIKHAATNTSPPVMNASPPLIRGINATWKNPLPIFGAGMMGDHHFQPTVQFCGQFVASQHAIGILFSTPIQPYYRIMHGCVPLDGVYRTITRMAGGEIYEIDGQPIVPLIDELYGNQEWHTQLPVKRLSIGVNMGDPYEPFQEEHYVNRLITGILANGRGIGLFEPDLEEGMQIQFMIRDSEEMFQSARHNTEALLQQIREDGKTPLLGLYIDCAGRAAAVSETLTEEAGELQTLFNQADIPLFGFYSGVEVAPLLGESRGLDWTGVLLVLTTTA